MSEKQTREILALVTTCRNHVLLSGPPVLFAKNEEELQTLASETARTLGGNVYRLANGLVLITDV